MLKYLAVLQARMTSTRLPGKVLKEINGRPMIEWQIRRILKSRIQDLIVVTSKDSEDDILCEYLHSIGVKYHRGSRSNVFSRYSEVINEHRPKNVIRLTADCPLMMPHLLDAMLTEFEKIKPDYMSNTMPPTFPDGLDLEIFSSEAFLKLAKVNLSISEQEHVTLGFYSRPNEFKLHNYESKINLCNHRWTVDYQDDLDFVRSIYANFVGMELSFNTDNVLELVANSIIATNKLDNSHRNISLQIADSKEHYE